jgi:hypothetical protein
LTLKTLVTHRFIAAVAVGFGASWPMLAAAQTAGSAAPPKAKVEIVQTVGCVAKRSGQPPSWWLTRAAAPTPTREGVFNRTQIDDAKKTLALGVREFHLVGVADFLDAEGLLQSGDRALFTSKEQVNATGELREGRAVMVKGLLVASGTEARLNLLEVVGLDEAICR